MNPIIDFTGECITDIQGYSGDTLKGIYNVYRQWCQDTAHRPMSRGKRFRQEIERMTGVESVERPNGKVRYFPGLRAEYRLDE